MRTLLIVLVLAGGLLAAAYGLGYIGSGDAAEGAYRFRTGTVDRGEVIDGVQASGTVQPVVLVQVGTQVSGVLARILVDFNSKVKAGDTLALIDPRTLEAKVIQSRASVTRARADADRVRALIAQAEKELARTRSLFERSLVGESELDGAVANLDSLRAQAAVGQAAIVQAEAQLSFDETNLGFCTILSPIDGVVVSRAVDVGQTVAASLSAPTLFTIANDLSKVQVQATVPEADIGRIREGQRVRFTVDAYPERSFEGRVSQVRLAATTVQNVVTYTVMVDAANPGELLIPGMTANATFEVARSAPDALRVPATALRLKPPAEIVEGGLPEAGAGRRGRAPTATASAGPGGEGGSNGDGPPSDGQVAGGRRWNGERGERGERPGGGMRPDGSRGRGGSRGFVYVQAGGGRLRAVPVRVGISDGAYTAVEVRDPEALPEGTEVVTAVQRDAEPAAVTNPFAPQMPRGGRGMGGGRMR